MSGGIKLPWGRAPATPATKRAASKAAKKAAARRKTSKRKAAPPRPGPFGAIDALGFFMLAGVIVSKAVTQRGAGGWRALLIPAPAAARLETPDAHEPGHGRNARSPTEIPARGWREILMRTWTEFNQDQIPMVAGAVTFFTLLSLFPALGAFVSLYGLFFDVGQAQKQLASLSGVLPGGAVDFLGAEMLRLSQARSGGLSLAFIATFLISLWSANGAVKAMFYGLNVAYEEHERRSFLTLNLTSLAFTVGALVFVMLAFGAVIAAPVILGYLGLDAGGAWLAELRWPVLLIITILGLSVLYRYGPSRAHARWRWITTGSIFAALLWLVASVAFSLYVANFGHYNKTYGSLGAVVGFMTWIWYSCTIVLFGAELNAEIEHQTAIDTTTGGGAPMGSRGARVADTLGAAPKPKAASQAASAQA